MPIIPEKRQLEDHVHGAVAAQFWSQGIENSRCLTGQSCTAPCEPQPLRLNAPSGLSRTQFLVATHAVRVPVFPGFCDEHGGTVVDRVLLQHGGEKWWCALIGRAKVQRAVHQRSAKTLCQNLADPDNYALAATGRLQLSTSTSLKMTAQVDSLQQLQPLMPQGGHIWPPQQHQQRGAGQQQPQQRQQPQRAGWSKMGQNSSLSLQLKQQLESLDLTADLAVNEPSVEGVRRYCTTPLRLAVDVAPSSSITGAGSKLKGLLFRVGLHGAVAPVEEAAAAGPAEQQQQHALSVHCQGAVALTGSKVLWEAQQKPWQAAAAAAKEHHQKQQKQRQRQLELAEQRVEQEEQQQRQQQQQQQAELPVQSLELGDSNSSSNKGVAGGATAAAAVADSDVPRSTGGTEGSGPGADQQLSGSSSSGDAIKERHHHHKHHHKHRSSTTSSASKPSDNSSSRRDNNRSSSRRVAPNPGDNSHGSNTVAGATAPHSSHTHSSSKKRYLTLRGEEIPLPLCHPGSLQESLQDSSSRIERLRTDLRLWRNRVEAGELQNLGENSKQHGLLGDKEPGSCWSSFLAGPHFKVSGLIGLLGRVPLQQRMLLLPSNPPLRRPNSSSSASLASSAADAQGSTGGTAAPSDEGGTSTAAAAVPSGKPLAHKARSFLAASATHLDRLVLGSARKLGSSITQESQLRIFGSGGASMQLGEMRGNFFDYTKLEAILDLGLNAPETSASSSGSTAAGCGRRGASSSVSSSSSRAVRQHRTRGGSSSGRAGHMIGSPGRGLGSILGPAAAVDLAAVAAPGDVLADAGSSSTAAAPAAAHLGRPPTTPAVAGKQSKHPAFALEERSVWHALTVSATQQLVGPVRLRGDWRFALDSNHPWPSGTAVLQPSAALQVLRHVVGISPALVDSAYGVDVVVPGAGGLVRLIGWYSPGRKEGGLEIRLM